MIQVVLPVWGMSYVFSRALTLGLNRFVRNGFAMLIVVRFCDMIGLISLCRCCLVSLFYDV